MSRQSRHTAPALALVLLLTASGAAHAQHASSEDMNKSNNPLNPAPALNFHDYYSPELYGVDDYTNDLLVRGAMILPPGKPLPWPQILRATVPISTRPDFGGGTTTGIGDANIFDILLLKSSGPTQLGAGPLLTMPTASEDALGAQVAGGARPGHGPSVVQGHPRGLDPMAGLVRRR